LVHTFAIGRAGAINVALEAAAVLALGDAQLAKKFDAYSAAQTKA
jgi:5-(carboxyamino)imidazole ribonucleotide mutase